MRKRGRRLDFREKALGPDHCGRLAPSVPSCRAGPDEPQAWVAQVGDDGRTTRANVSFY